jgi:hypothetical protein
VLSVDEEPALILSKNSIKSSAVKKSEVETKIREESLAKVIFGG